MLLLCIPTAIYNSTPHKQLHLSGFPIVVEAFFVREETINSNFQRVPKQPAGKLSSTHSSPQPTTCSPTTTALPTYHMAGTEEPHAAPESSNALANGQDKVEPSQKRRRKSGGNGADADAHQPQGDAVDGSGRGQPDEEDNGILGARGRGSIVFYGVVIKRVCGCLWTSSVCGRLAGILYCY